MTLEFYRDKEKLVMKLLKEEKNWQQIAKEAHVSCSFISTVKKKIVGEPVDDSMKLSIPSQALKLFSEGKSVLDVTIELDRPLEEIRIYYEDYLDTMKLSDLILLMEFHQENLPTIKKMIRFILSNPVSKNDLLVALALATDISRLKNVKKRLEENISSLNEKRGLY